jgi:predicted Zn-dependent protease
MLRPAVVIVLLLATGIHGCTTNPVSGKKQPSLMSEEREIATGRKFDPKIRKQYGVYDDPELQAYVTRIGKKLAAQSHRPNLVYRFTVLDSPQVNAFALPGGYIYITRGLMAYLNSEAELAAVLGHEIGHVTAKHAVRQYTASTAASIGYTIAALFNRGLANQNAANLFNILGSALISGYGREHELEADRLGAEYLARAGHDPQAILGVLGVLKNQEEFEKERAEIEGREARVYHGVFASHPSADKRLQEVVAESKQSTAATPRVGRDEFLAQLDGVVFGDSTHQGIRYNQKFFHKKLGFALEFPPGWRIENRPKQIEASSRDNNAVMVLAVEDLNRHISPREFMLKRLRLKKLKQEGTLTGTDLEGYTAIARVHGPFGSRDTRVTVVYFNDKAYIFHATGKTDSAFKAADELFLQTARSFHALTGDERKLAEGLRIEIIETNQNDSFAELAVDSPIPNYPARILRLINDKYPEGQPGIGKLKVIR